MNKTAQLLSSVKTVLTIEGREDIHHEYEVPEKYWTLLDRGN